MLALLKLLLFRIVFCPYSPSLSIPISLSLRLSVPLCFSTLSLSRTPYTLSGSYTGLPLGLPCIAGTFSAVVGSTSCIPCAVTVPSLYSGVGFSQCITCPLGHYCPTPKQYLPCPAGFYNSIGGLSSASACQRCIVNGTMCPSGSSVIFNLSIYFNPGLPCGTNACEMNEQYP